jgi:hypothetical protein
VFAHTATADNGDFDSNAAAEPEVGRVAYYCRFRPDMKALPIDAR